MKSIIKERKFITSPLRKTNLEKGKLTSQFLLRLDEKA